MRWHRKDAIEFSGLPAATVVVVVVMANLLSHHLSGRMCGESGKDRQELDKMSMGSAGPSA